MGRTYRPRPKAHWAVGAGATAMKNGEWGGDPPLPQNQRGEPEAGRGRREVHPREVSGWLNGVGSRPDPDHLGRRKNRSGPVG